uniref:Uncharacterized protein n=1 Tax=Arundo donax TaxID=35708 RepID=A0A0A8ZDE2_ARUDO
MHIKLKKIENIRFIECYVLMQYSSRMVYVRI